MHCQQNRKIGGGGWGAYLDLGMFMHYSKVITLTTNLVVTPNKQLVLLCIKQTACIKLNGSVLVSSFDVTASKWCTCHCFVDMSYVLSCFYKVGDIAGIRNSQYLSLGISEG